MGCQILKSSKYVKSQVCKMNDAIDIAYACMIARQPCLFIGNPGTGKSHSFKLIANMFGSRDKDWFYQSITAKTSPEKLFGGIIAEKMLDGVEEYNLSVGAASFKGIIFDELFKSQHPAMMNMLLNFFDEEPTIFSGGKNHTPEWEYAFTTTNFEDLEDDLRYDPLWDRMAAKYVVNNLSHADSKTALKMVMQQSKSSQQMPKLSIEDLHLARKAAMAIEISDSIVDCFYEKVLPQLEKGDRCYVSQRKINSLFIGKKNHPSIIQSIAYMISDNSTEILGYVPYFVWQDRQTLNRLLDDVQSAIVVPSVKTYRQIVNDLEAFISQLESNSFASHELAQQKLNLLMNAVTTTVNSIADIDKKKVPDALRQKAASLSKKSKEIVDSMVIQTVNNMEF